VVDALGIEAAADWNQVRTPETYLGHGRSSNFISSERRPVTDLRHTYQIPDRLRFNHWALAGKWTIERKSAVIDRAGGSIAYRFHARDAHLVMSAGSRDQIPFRVLLDGTPPGNAHGPTSTRTETACLQTPALPTRPAGRQDWRTHSADFVPRARGQGIRAHLRIAGRPW
jgi:hypothetical protein